MAVTVGTNHSCAIGADGSLACWGANDAGQATPPTGTFVALSAGATTTCAIAVDGSLACWGANDAGQATPPQGRFVSVGVGDRFACAVATTGVPTCWGDTTAPGATPTPKVVLSQIAVGGDHTCGIASNGILVCWGADDLGQSDPPVPGAPILSAPIPNQKASQDAEFSFEVPKDTFTDTDELTWSVTQANGDRTALPAWLRFDPATRTLSGTPQDADVGSLPITVIATDTTGLTGRATFTLTIANVNDPPQAVTPIPDQDATEDSTWTYVLPENAFTDLDLDSGDVLTWSVANGDGTALPAWLRFDPATRTLSGTPQDADVGSLPITVIATDKEGAAASTGFTLTIANVNDPPQAVTPIPDQDATEDSTWTYVLPENAFTDLDLDSGDVLTWSVANGDGTALPAWLRFDPATRTLSGTPQDADVGSLPITVIATDTTGLTGRATFTLTIANVNDPPQAVTPIPDQDATEDSTWTYVLPENAFTDLDLDSGDVLTWSVANGDGTALPAWLRFDPATRTLSGTPQDADVGSLPITVIATDKEGAAASTGFTLTIANVNDPPQAVTPIPDQDATEDSTWTYVLPENAFTDLDLDSGDVLTWSVANGDGTALPAWLRFDPATRTLSGTPQDADVGSLPITVIATDKEGAAASTGFTLTIANVNDPPQAVTPIPDQDATEDSTWTYVLPENAFTDLDLDSGDVLTWSVANGDGTALPAWLRFDPATRTLSGTPSRDDIGTLNLLVTVTDTGGQSIQAGLNVRIARLNHPPTVAKTIPRQKAIQDQGFTFTFPKDTFAEQDAEDTLAYDAVQKDGTPLPSWLGFARSDRMFQGVPRDSDVGTLVITVTAMDKAGATASTDFALEIINVDDPPSLVTRIPDQTTDQDQPFTSTLSEDAFTDPDSDTGDTLKLRAVGPDGGDLPQWLTFDPETRTFSGTPRDADAGNLVVTVVATDIAGVEASGSFTITVNDVNDVPSVSQPTPDQLATVSQPFSLVLTTDMFTDPDTAHGDSLTYSATLEDGSPLAAWLTFDSETLAFAGTPGVADAARLSVSVIATDNHDAKGVDTFFLDVTPERDVPTAPVVVVRRVPVASTGALAILVTWSAGKEAAQGRAKYEVQIRQQSKGKWGKYRPYATATGRTGLNKNVKPGTYQLRLRATPAGGKAGAWIEADAVHAPPGPGIGSDHHVHGPLGQGVGQGRLRWQCPTQSQTGHVIHGDHRGRQHRAGDDLGQGPGHHRGLPRRRSGHTRRLQDHRPWSRQAVSAQRGDHLPGARPRRAHRHGHRPAGSCRARRGRPPVNARALRARARPARSLGVGVPVHRRAESGRDRHPQVHGSCRRVGSNVRPTATLTATSNKRGGRERVLWSR